MRTTNQTYFQYAALLGDVPIVISADWNNLSDKNRELVCAKFTGDWVEALEHLAETTDSSKASKDLQKSTTHSGGTEGNRVDFSW